MPVTEETTFVEYLGNGSTTTGYAIPFSYDAAADIEVYLDGVQTTDFSVNTTTNEVTTSVAQGSSVTVLITRTTEQSQTFNPAASGDLSSSLLTRTFDRIVQMVQDTLRMATRAVKVPRGESIADLPKESLRADRYDYFDSSGDPAPKTATEVVQDLSTNGGLPTTPFEEITTSTASGGGFVTTASTTVLAGTATSAEQASFREQAGAVSTSHEQATNPHGITPETIGAQPDLMAYAAATRTTTQTIAIGSGDVVIWDDVTSDPFGALDSSSGVFTVPVGQGGLYLVSARVRWATGFTNYAKLSVFIDGTVDQSYQDARSQLSGHCTQVVAQVVVAEGEEITIVAQHGDGSAAKDIANTAPEMTKVQITRIL